MKDIKSFHAPKYDNGKYIPVEDGIYKLIYRGITVYYTSLSFVQETKYGEGENAADISEYPLGDVLEKYGCVWSDFYKELNVSTSETCYGEFYSRKLEGVRNLRSIIGKHIYNVENEDETIDLVIE